MAANDLQIQPSQDQHVAETELPSDDVLTEDEIIEKSTVYIDPMAPDQSGRFQKGDVVHMDDVEGGIRAKGTFTVAEGRRHPSGSYYEYQLIGAGGSSYKDGAWIRERKLRKESS